MCLKLLPLTLALAMVPMLGHSEDLLDAYRAARINDPTLAQAKADQAATAENVPQARAVLLPQLSATLSFTQRDSHITQDGIDTSGITGRVRTRSPSLTLSQTVLDFSKYANLEAAHAQVDAQDQRYRAALQDLYVRVAKAYFQVLTDTDILSYNKANEEMLRQQYEQAEQSYKVGLKAITDMYQAKADYEKAKADTIAAQNTLNDDREALTQITGTSSDHLKKLRAPLPLDPPTPTHAKAWVKQALQFNPAILSKQYAVAATEHEISSARAGHLPTVDFSLGRSKTDTWGEHGGGVHIPYGNSATLALNMPLFQGGRVQSEVRQSIAKRESAKDALEIQRRQVVRDTLNYFRSTLAGIAKVQADKASVDSAQKALEASRAGFQVGTKSMLDVLKAIQTLTEAQKSYAQDRHQFIINKLLLKQASGTIRFEDLQRVNTLLQ